MRKLIAIALMVSMSAVAADPSPASKFITLGTAGGPESHPDRSQPANALLVGDDLYLVDAGDGAAGQLAKAGFRVPQVRGLFLSHLHFDHTGGVLAVVGLRMQLNAHETLTVYGPPGTQAFINGLLAAIAPAMEAAYGMPGRSWEAHVEVRELADGSKVKLDGLTVQAAENSHFRIPEASDGQEKAKSLSFRFDLSDRSIIFTGDTGPSENMEKLAQDADLLISEMMDIPAVLANIRRVVPDMPDKQFQGIEWHFRAHHLLPKQVGELASRANVAKVVVTHMVPSIDDEAAAKRYHAEIAAEFDGDIAFAKDLDRF